MSVQSILEGYAQAAPELIARFEAIPCEALYRPVAELLTATPCRILDVGAGTGRDAAWLARQGHKVLAVEPVAALREAGMALHSGAGIDWLDDRLPELPEVRRLGRRFDRILLSGVWQHLAPAERPPALRRLAQVAAPGGRLILSIRHGPGAPDRRCFEASAEEALAAAAQAGFRPILRRAAPSIQPANRAAGVTWTWLGVERVQRSVPGTEA